MSVLLLSDLFVQLDFNSFVACYVKIFEQIKTDGWMDGTDMIWVALNIHRSAATVREINVGEFCTVCRCRPRTVEQSSIAPERRRLIVQWIPAVAKDISVWTVGPRRSVNCI